MTERNRIPEIISRGLLVVALTVGGIACSDEEPKAQDSTTSVSQLEGTTTTLSPEQQAQVEVGAVVREEVQIYTNQIKAIQNTPNDNDDLIGFIDPSFRSEDGIDSGTWALSFNGNSVSRATRHNGIDYLETFGVIIPTTIDPITGEVKPKSDNNSNDFIYGRSLQVLDGSDGSAPIEEQERYKTPQQVSESFQAINRSLQEIYGRHGEDALSLGHQQWLDSQGN